MDTDIGAGSTNHCNEIVLRLTLVVRDIFALSGEKFQGSTISPACAEVAVVDTEAQRDVG